MPFYTSSFIQKIVFINIKNYSSLMKTAIVGFVNLFIRYLKDY
nr:MAG TPA: hypothetical protein [Caudoviricetes sp.]